jgi:uncharacterized membrane protein
VNNRFFSAGGTPHQCSPTHSAPKATGLSNEDLADTRLDNIPVIPAQAGIQQNQKHFSQTAFEVKHFVGMTLGSRLRGNDGTITVRPCFSAIRRIFVVRTVTHADTGSTHKQGAVMTAFNFILILHVIFGIIAFVAAPGAMMTKKGSLWHKRFGSAFFYAMMAVAASAFILWTLGSQLFLMLLAVFSFYLAFSGYRAVKIKNGPAEKIDWSVAGAALVAGISLVVLGALNLFRGESFGYVTLALGAGCAVSAARDLWRFARPVIDKQAWLINHLTKMLGAYIATVTAVSAVNFHLLPPVWRWLWPTIIIAPFIFMWVRRYKMRALRTRNVTV